MERKQKFNILLNEKSSIDGGDEGNSSYDNIQIDKNNSFRKPTLIKQRFASKYWRWIALPWFWMFTFGAYYSYY